MANKKDEKAAPKQPETPKKETTAPKETEKKQDAPKKENAAPKETAAMAAAKKVAKGIFDGSPAMKEVHVASDGTAFYALNDAKNYARNLKNREVISLKREDVK